MLALKRLFGAADIFHFGRIYNGMRAFLKGWRIIRSEKLTRYVWVPGILSLITGMTLAAFLLMYFVSLFERWLGQLDLPGMQVLAALGALFITFIIFIFSFRILAAIWVVPFLGPMQEKLEIFHGGKTLSHSLRDDFINALRGFWSSIWQALLSLVLLLTTIFLGPLQILILMPFEAYFSARSLLILFIEKEHKIHSERKKALRLYRPEMMGLGLAYVICLFLPGVGVILAPSIGLAGAAELYFDRKKSNA